MRGNDVVTGVPFPYFTEWRGTVTLQEKNLGSISLPLEVVHSGAFLQ